MNPLKILIVDDHPIVREGLKALLSTQSDMDVVAEAGTGTEAIEQVRQHNPDVVLLDLMLPDADGASVVEALVGERRRVNVIVLSSTAAEEDVRASMHAGARGYLLKGASSEEILSAIRRVSEGMVFIAQYAAERLAESTYQERLTERELDILELIVDGKTNKEIAAALGIGEGTIKTHVHNILDKLHVRDRAAAVTSAIRKGLVRP